MSIQIAGNFVNLSNTKKDAVEILSSGKLEESFSVLNKKRLENNRIKNQINKKKTSRYLEDLTNKGD